MWGELDWGGGLQQGESDRESLCIDKSDLVPAAANREDTYGQDGCGR